MFFNKLLETTSSGDDVISFLDSINVFLKEYPWVQIAVMLLLFIVVIVWPDATRWIARKRKSRMASTVGDLELAVAQQESKLVAANDSLRSILVLVVNALDRTAANVEYKFELLLLKNEFVRLYAAYTDFRHYQSGHPIASEPLTKWWVDTEASNDMRQWKTDLQAYVRCAKAFANHWNIASVVYDERLFQSIGDWDQSVEKPTGIEFNDWLQSYGAQLLDGIKQQDNDFRERLNRIKSQIRDEVTAK